MLSNQDKEKKKTILTDSLSPPLGWFGLLQGAVPCAPCLRTPLDFGRGVQYYLIPIIQGPGVAQVAMTDHWQ